jgi:hypothetical protein
MVGSPTLENVKWIVQKYDGTVDWIHVVRDGGQGAGSCEFGNDTSGSKTCNEFRKWLRNY